MGNMLVNTRDQKFLLYEQIGIEKLFETEKYADYNKETVDMMINEAEKLAVEVLLPTYEKGDKEGCKLEKGRVKVPACFHDAYKKFCEAGWLCCMRSVESGGQGMPNSVAQACYEFFQAANYPLVMYPGLTNGAAGLIDRYGSPEQKKKYMERMYTGEWGGTMCLTEPGAGSDVGSLKTTAKRLPDGTYSIQGTKIFISSGDHDLTPNNIHTVLARIEGDPAGTRGISIFVVPKFRVKADGSLGPNNDVTTGGIEHKMGIKGSATAMLIFGEEGKCVGELLGKEREGMKVMFNLMNEARIEVGLQGLGTATAAYEHAVDYAKQRLQGAEIFEFKNPEAPQVPIIRHADIRRQLLWMKAHVEGCRALLYYTSFCQDMMEAAATKDERQQWASRADLLIPVCKAYVTNRALDVCSIAIDVYGGYGYCSEYPVEQYMRDCKITQIYEGTNGIQALDLVGRKLGIKKGMHLLAIAKEMDAAIATVREEIPELSSYVNYLAEAKNALTDLTIKFFKLGKSASFLVPILYASPYLNLFGDVAVGYLLMEAAGIAQKKLNAIYAEAGAKGSKAKQRAMVHTNAEVAFYQGKIASAKFFAVNVLTSVRGRAEGIKAGDRTPIEIADESFSV